MDLWVNGAYLAIPLLLGAVGGVNMIGLVMFIYPLVSILYFIVRHRYLKSLPTEVEQRLVPYSHGYTGRAISMVILILSVAACVMAAWKAIYP